MTVGICISYYIFGVKFSNKTLIITFIFYSSIESLISLQCIDNTVRFLFQRVLNITAASTVLPWRFLSRASLYIWGDEGFFGGGGVPRYMDNSQGYDNCSDSDAVRVYSGDLLSWFFLCVSIERDWTASLESRLSTHRE